MRSQTARVGKNNRAQVVTIPLEFRFPDGMKNVFIRKVGEEIIFHQIKTVSFIGTVFF